jgi:hypothetical protein
MATYRCKDFQSFLEPWMNGERSPEARAHVRDCPECAMLAGDLEAIHTSARDWGAADAVPPGRIWTAIRAQLEAEKIIREPQLRKETGGWFEGAFRGLRRPALASVYVGVIVAVAFLVSGPVTRHYNQQRWLDGTEDFTVPVNTQLTSAEQAAVSSFGPSDPGVTASLNQNLEIVDNYIALCEKSVQEDPENELARDYLYSAYQQKADLLAQISGRGGYGR